MALNDEIRDLQVRHHVGIQRLSSAILRGLITLLDRSDLEIVSKLLDRGPTLEGTFTSMRLRYLLDALRLINHEAHVTLGQELRDDLKGLARYEVDFQARLLASTMPVDFVQPTASMLDAIVTSRPFDGRLLRDWVMHLRDGKRSLLRQAIQRGMIQGETQDQIVRRVRGTKALNYRDGVLNIARTSVERLVRTSVNHVANAAREKLYEENAAVVSKVQWVATLDTRTCTRCAAMDGKTFVMGKGPRPPLHLNCRCATVPVTKSWKAMGIDLPEVDTGTRASMNGQVSATDTFGTWLRKQSAAVQDEALGATRGALFRRGKLAIEKFTDVRGNALTLNELRAREAAAFKLAGLAA